MPLMVQVVSLGAGKDSLYFRLKDRGIGPAGGYVEVDFPAVSTWKATLVARNPALSALANGEHASTVFSALGCCVLCVLGQHCIVFFFSLCMFTPFFCLR